jgi:hypothetical protein
VRKVDITNKMVAANRVLSPVGADGEIIYGWDGTYSLVFLKGQKTYGRLRLVKQKTKGACLCGSVTFEIDGAFEHFFLCHCTRCRKDTGSAHASNIFAPGGKVSWVSGHALVRAYRLPGTRHGKSFCAICGSALPDVQMNGALLVVPAGSLDSSPEIRPQARISWESRACWDEGLGNLPKVEGLPK